MRNPTATNCPTPLFQPGSMATPVTLPPCQPDLHRRDITAAPPEDLSNISEGEREGNIIDVTTALKDRAHCNSAPASPRLTQPKYPMPGASQGTLDSFILTQKTGSSSSQTH